MSRTVVYVGPTMSHDEARAALPGATILPPVAAGDLVQLEPARGDVVVIIDGYFRQQGSVRHKEILHCLDRGAIVIGAASMGALRAAELRRFGMVGVGRAFEAYASGELEGDDEVTVTHHGAPSYRPVSEALVNVREQLRAAELDGCITAGTASAILEDTCSRTFSDRTWQALLASARRRGGPARELDALERHVIERRQDVKRADALQALSLVRTGEIPQVEPSTEALHLHTVHFDRLVVNARWEEDEDGAVRELDVLKLCRLDKGHPRLRQRVLLRELAVEAARRGGHAPSEPAQLLERFWDGIGLPHPSDRDAWLAERRLGGDELAAVLQGKELTRLAAGSDEEPSPAALRRIAARHLRDIGAIAEDADLPTQVKGLLSPAERQTLRGEAAVTTAATRAMTAPRWEAPLIAELKVSGRYARAVPETRTILEFAELTGVARPQEETALERQVADWLRARWGSTDDDLTWALLDRGFSSTRELSTQAYPHFIYLSTVATADR